jgi:TRAP-type C4-dicarboxylate transport system permease small subunit
MKRVIERARALSRGIGVAELILGALLVVLIFVLVLLQIWTRYFPIGHSVWIGEIARFALVWLTFATAGYLVSRGEHPTIETIDLVGGGRFRRPVQAFAHVILAVIAIWLALDAAALVTNPSGQVTPVTGIPLTVINILPMIGFALSAVHGFIRAAIFAFGVDRPEDAPSGEEGAAFV